MSGPHTLQYHQAEENKLSIKLRLEIRIRVKIRITTESLETIKR